MNKSPAVIGPLVMYEYSWNHSNRGLHWLCQAIFELIFCKTILSFTKKLWKKKIGRKHLLRLGCQIKNWRSKTIHYNSQKNTMNQKYSFFFKKKNLELYTISYQIVILLLPIKHCRRDTVSDQEVAVIYLVTGYKRTRRRLPLFTHFLRARLWPHLIGWYPQPCFDWIAVLPHYCDELQIGCCLESETGVDTTDKKRQ